MIILSHIIGVIVLVQMLSIALYVGKLFVCSFKKDCKRNSCPFCHTCRKYYYFERKKMVEEEAEKLKHLIFKD